MPKAALFILLMALPLMAVYNPFFEDTPAAAPLPTKPAALAPATPKPSKTRVKALYFGFIETTKKRLALIKIGGENIVVKEHDTLFVSDQEYRVYRISSSYLVLSDRFGRKQSIYFSGVNRD